MSELENTKWYEKYQTDLLREIEEAVDEDIRSGRIDIEGVESIDDLPKGDVHIIPMIAYTRHLSDVPDILSSE